MSSDKACENHAHRKPKVSYARSIRVGLVGPKLRARAVSDGQPVNIPAPFTSLSIEGTQEGRSSVPNGHGASPIIGAIQGEGKAEGQPEAIRLSLSCQEKPRCLE